MKHYKSNAELKDLAKERLTGKFSNALFALVLVDLVTRAVSNVTASFIPTGSLLWSILSILFTSLIAIFLGVLQTGIAYYFLNAACNRPYNYSNIFYGLQQSPERSIKVSAVRVLANTICLLPYQILLLLFLRSFQYTYFIAAGIAMAIGYVILTPFILSISQVFYLLLDFPDASPGETIMTSIRIMKGHKWRLFLLELSFLPLQLLCILSFGLGFLWLNPYMRMTYTLFFLDLMNPAGQNTTHESTYDSNPEDQISY